jgi:hypothetical protein
MRPTLLQFRSAKEKTPTSYNPRSTYDGRSLCFRSPKGDDKRCTFSCEKRFVAYDVLAKRTGYRVGPGAYSPELYRPKIRSGSPYREFHCQKDTSNNGYYMVGNSMEFDPHLLLSTKKKIQPDKDIMIDSTHFSGRMSRSAATTNHSVSEQHQILESPTIKPHTKNRPKENKKKKKYLSSSVKINDLIGRRFN